MNRRPNTHLYETIKHTTDACPYSIHHTQLPADCNPALYLHWHNELEFLMLHKGILRFQIEDKTFTLKEGESIFIPSGLLHSAENIGTTPIAFSALVFSPALLIEDLQSPAHQKYILPVLHNNLMFSIVIHTDIPWQAQLLNHLTTILQANKPDELFVRGHALLLWNLLYKEHICKLCVRPALDTLTLQMTPALDYLKAHYKENLTLRLLADTVHLSEGQFCRSFKQFTGMTPFQYLNRYRILQSCQKLYDTDEKITDIAYSHGFNNISYYNRAFLKLMNMTPTEYRQRKNC